MKKTFLNLSKIFVALSIVVLGQAVLFIKTQRRKGVGRVGEGIAEVTAVL
jgi:hypothetical protein